MSGNSEYSEILSMNGYNTKIVYTSDSIIFREQNKKTESLFVDETVIFSDNKDFIFPTLNIYDGDINFTDKLDYYYTTYVFDDTFNASERQFNIYSPLITVQDSFTVDQNNYDYRYNAVYEYKDNLTYQQNWCDADNFIDNNIYYQVNADILVNKIIYNTFNISRYKFSIQDDFSFFIGDDVSQGNKNIVRINHNFSCGQIQNINGEQNINVKQNINGSFDIVDKSNINKKQYYVYSNIDDEIINNNIHLNKGQHIITIKKLNTTKSYDFNITVLTPYRLQNDIVYQLDYKDIENAKYYSNYIVDENTVNIFDNTIKVI